MSDLEIITATEASRSFSEMLHRVSYGGQSFVIKKGNRLMARLLPVETAEGERAEELPVVVTDLAIEAELPSGPTEEENEFYQAWMEQVRKVEA